MWAAPQMKQFVSNFHGHACTQRAHGGFGSFQSVNLKGWTLPSRAELASISAKWGLQQANPSPSRRLPRDALRAWRGYLWAWRFADWMPGLWKSTLLILMSHRWGNSVAGKTVFLAHFVKNASNNTEQMWAQLQHFNWHLYSLHLESNSNII